MAFLMFIVYLFVASACAWIADRFVPGSIPGGFFPSVIFGVIGAWAGTSLMGALGPSLAGVPLIPAIVGSALVIFLFSFFTGRMRHGAA